MNQFVLHKGVTIGFEEEMYSAGESDGIAFVVAVVLTGELATTVTVDFTTESLTASSKIATIPVVYIPNFCIIIILVR